MLDVAAAAALADDLAGYFSVVIEFVLDIIRLT